MSLLHQAWEKIPIEGEIALITADQVRSLTGREPRLMMKFDHSQKLPPVLKQSGRFILPLRNGLYALLKGQGYHRPEPCSEVQNFARQTRFRLKTTDAGISEMQHLDIAFNTGLLGHFLEESVLYPTIRGRKRSPHFAFEVGEHSLEVEGVQVEIDGGFEGRTTVTVVEAKIGECEDFHLRQLYYPFRFWSSLTSKRVRPVFFTYEPNTQTYRFREYRFEPAERYDSPRLVKAAAYRIVDPADTWSQTRELPRTAPVPQADRLEKVALVPFLVAEGSNSPEALAPLLEFSKRQGRYYLDAARSLGLLNDSFELTSLGKDYISAVPEVRRGILCHAVLKLPLCQEILANLILSPGATLDRDQLARLTQRSTGLAVKTAHRRSQTLWSWLSWVASHSDVLSLTGNELRLGPKTTRGGEIHQLKLF